jgi:hypothetical protein
VNRNMVTIRNLRHHGNKVGVSLSCAVFLDIFDDRSMVVPYYNFLGQSINRVGGFFSVPAMGADKLITLVNPLSW